MEPAPTRGRWTRPWGAAVSVVALLAVAWPLGREPVREDDFPLSTYPMFAPRRKDARVVLDYAIAVGADERRVHLSPFLVGTSEPMQAMMTINRAVSRGHGAALCGEIARRLATRPGYRAYDEVRLVTGNHLAVDYLVRGQRGTETVRARCPIERGPR